MEPVKRTKKIPHLPALAGLMILIPVLFAAGCTGSTPAVPGLLLNGTGWTLTEYFSNGTAMQVLDGTAITMDFTDEGRITGSSGCNHYFAGYEMRGTAIAFGQAGSTEMYCMSPGVMEQESAYLSLLNRAVSVTTGNDSLTFTDAGGAPILRFARKVPPAPVPLTGTNWTLESFHTEEAVSSVIAGTTITAVFDENGHVSGTAGCNRYFASCTINGTKISIGSVGSTKMYCSGPGIMQQESTYLAALDRTAVFAINGNRLTLADVNGTALLSYAGGS